MNLTQNFSQAELQGLYDALETERERFRAAFDHAAVGLCIVDTAGNIVQVNTTYSRILGYRVDELLKMNRADFIHPDDFERSSLEIDRLLTGEVPAFQIEKRYIRKDGSVVWVKNSVSLLKDRTGRAVHLISVSEDITEQKQLLSDLSAAKNQAESANALKTTFLANVSHEIRTPLGAILGFADLLKDPNLTEEERLQFLNVISRNGKSLLRIIDDVLDLSKIESGHLPLENISFSFSDLMKEVLILFQEKVKAKGIALDLIFETELPRRVRSDPTRIRQVLLNIVGNAIKFTEKGSVSIRVRSETTTEGHLKLAIEVQDSGLGISETQRERLFLPFTQAHQNTTRKFGGTGLGLVLSRRLATALGGDVVLEKSTLGEGSIFSIQFVVESNVPLAPQESQEKEVIEKTAQTRLAGVRVLLADDSPDNQYIVERLLSLNGAKVELANNGSEALHKALGGNYDLVLMDIQMPEVDGYEATRRLRASGFRKPVIALTAHAMLEERIKTLEAGCDFHLTKPLNFDVLLNTVEQYTTRH